MRHFLPLSDALRKDEEYQKLLKRVQELEEKVRRLEEPDVDLEWYEQFIRGSL